MQIPRGSARTFLMNVVLSYDGDDCLFWPFSRSKQGYGDIRIEGEHIQVHAFVCEKFNGPRPEGDYQAAHTCGNGHLGCCARAHLVWKTRDGNMQDMVVHGRSQRGTKMHMAKLCEGDVREIRKLRGRHTQPEIAKMFGVSRGCVQAILERRNWAWLDD